MEGGCKGDVGGVVLVAGFCDGVTGFESTSVV